MNRMLLIGGSVLALGAVALWLLRGLDTVGLAINLAAIAIGLLMGKGIGMFLFRRVLPTANK